MNFPVERLGPSIENEEDKKKQFGIELGKGKQAFEAACVVCGERTSEALYVSQNWLNDPIVIAAKDLYLKTVHNSKDLLDADEFAAKLLRMAEEKNASNTFYVLDGKDRVNLLSLYAKVRGFDKSVAAPANNFMFKQINVRFVKPEPKILLEEKLIDQSPKEDNPNNKSSIKLKLVS